MSSYAIATPLDFMNEAGFFIYEIDQLKRKKSHLALNKTRI